MSGDAGGDGVAVVVVGARVGVNVAAVVVVAVEASVVVAVVVDVGCPRRTKARMWKKLAFVLDLYDG